MIHEKFQVHNKKNMRKTIRKTWEKHGKIVQKLPIKILKVAKSMSTLS